MIKVKIIESIDTTDLETQTNDFLATLVDQFTYIDIKFINAQDSLINQVVYSDIPENTPTPP